MDTIQQTGATTKSSSSESVLSKIWTGFQVVGALLLIGVYSLFVGIWSGIKWCGRMIARIHAKTGDMKRTLIVTGSIVTAIFAYVYLFFVEVSALAAGPMLGWIGVVFFYVVVKYGHSEIDLIQELQEGNDAVANHFRSYALIIAVLLSAPVLALAL